MNRADMNTPEDAMLVSALKTELWSIFELELSGPQDGNPFVDVKLSAEFHHLKRVVHVDGFYDGDGVFLMRFMPDVEGEWTYTTHSSSQALDGRSGQFTCIPAGPGNHGPVHASECQFGYADGSRYAPFGTTCYAWIHQPEELQEETLRTLASSPFNKIRMCIFPKRYIYNENEPDVFPYVKKTDGDGFDLSRFDPVFWRNLDKRIGQLCDQNIEADIILFHPYDEGHWGFDRMDAASDDFYLRYVIARLAAYRNVWWSAANEWDYMSKKTSEDFDRFLSILEEYDPFHHLRSNHNGTTWYDHNKSWITHASIQNPDPAQSAVMREKYDKPIVFDECRYEGNIENTWGNITAELMTQRFWEGVVNGGYVTHGETYVSPNDILWWSKGGTLHGESPKRIAFLRQILEEAPADLMPDTRLLGGEGGAMGVMDSSERYILIYFSSDQPARRYLYLPVDGSFTIEVIDTWNMSVSPMPGTYTGKFRIDLPGKPYIAIRVRRVN